MKVDLAAKYVDESESTFRKRVEDGIYPAGKQIGGNRYWFLADLETAVNDLRNGQATADPFMEAINAR
jgi:hypothetical protein